MCIYIYIGVDQMLFFEEWPFLAKKTYVMYEYLNQYYLNWVENLKRCVEPRTAACELDKK